MDTDNICKICDKEVSKYTCPRCNLPYCSMACYKSENHLQCSESFFKDCISEELGVTETDPATKKKMLAVLERIHSQDEAAFDNPEAMMQMLNEAYNDADDGEMGNFSGGADFSSYMADAEDPTNNGSLDSDDDSSLPDLSSRLAGVDLEDSETVWQLLSPDERQEFEAMISSGNVAELLPEWKPWWAYRRKRRLVQEVGEADDEEEKYEEMCPQIVQNVKDFSSISKHKPAACVKHNLVNVLSAYVLSVRMFNGSLHSLPGDAAGALLMASGNLRQGDNYQDVETAVQAVTQASNANPLISNTSEAQSLMKEDLRCVVRGPEDSNKMFYINCALSEMHALLTSVKNAEKSDARTKKDTKSKGDFTRRFLDKDFEVPGDVKKSLSSAIRKIEYYLSYCKDWTEDFKAIHNDFFFNDIL